MADTNAEFEQSDSRHDHVEYSEAGVEFMRWLARSVVRRLKLEQKHSVENEIKRPPTL